MRYEWISSWLADPQSWLPGTRMPTFFLPSGSGNLQSPFTGIVDHELFLGPKARLMVHMDSERELGTLLGDAEALIAAIRDYVWSLSPPRED